MYEWLVRDGGIVAFHDIVPIEGEGPRPQGTTSTSRAARCRSSGKNCASTRDVVEFVEDWESGRFGIGAVRVRR